MAPLDTELVGPCSLAIKYAEMAEHSQSWRYNPDGCGCIGNGWFVMASQLHKWSV